MEARSALDDAQRQKFVTCSLGPAEATLQHTNKGEVSQLGKLSKWAPKNTKPTLSLT